MSDDFNFDLGLDESSPANAAHQRLVAELREIGHWQGCQHLRDGMSYDDALLLIMPDGARYRGEVWEQIATGLDLAYAGKRP